MTSKIQFCICFILGCLSHGLAMGAPPLRLVIAGLTHGHVEGFLFDVRRRQGFELVGIAETNRGAIDRYVKKFNLDPEIVAPSVQELILRSKPDVIAVFGATSDHLEIVRQAADHKIAVMMEKPLASDHKDAAEISRMATEANIPVVVNYETTWYPNTHALFNPEELSRLGAIKKVVVHSGHRGPLEIGVHPDFLAWLTDPARGGGALLDFGCYGVQFISKIFQDRKPIAVTAVTQKFKSHPAYQHVEDEAQLIIEYPGAVGIVQASWNWTWERKDWEVYGDQRSMTSQGRDHYIVKEANGHSWNVAAPRLSGSNADPLSYLQALLSGGNQSSGVAHELSSLPLNLEVSRILDAAAQSAREGRRVEL